MGLDINAVQFLIAARRQGIEFGDVLTIGRQDLNVYPAKMVKILAKNQLPADRFAPGAPDTGYAEPCFKALGARNVSSLDVSRFEGAEFIHDLNLPIGPDLKEKFDLVYDGGTLEHVFNFPVALKNCMEMVKAGGSLFLHTVTNNYCGHGFYQFSPELFFRAFSAGNGFKVERMVLHVMGPYARWYEVSDPQSIQSRVELITCFPMQLLVRARRIVVMPIFEMPLQQSDYVPRWRGSPGSASPGSPASGGRLYGAHRSRLAGWLPGLARLLNVLRIGLGLLRGHTIFNRKCFHPVKRG